MPTRVERRTVNLSAYPDLVVIYLGMRVNRIAGIKTLLGFGPKISSSAAAQPDGLLRHETFIYSLFPMHVGMRQYWRDANSLLEWTRSDPHRPWWQSFLKDSGGTGFWSRNVFSAWGHRGCLRRSTGNIGLMAWYRLADRCLAQLRGPKRNLESHRYCPRRSSTAGQKVSLLPELARGSGSAPDAAERRASGARCRLEGFSTDGILGRLDGAGSQRFPAFAARHRPPRRLCSRRGSATILLIIPSSYFCSHTQVCCVETGYAFSSKPGSGSRSSTHCQISAGTRLVPLQGECQEEHDR